MQNERNELKRENYAVIDKKNSGDAELFARLYQRYPEEYSKCFEDESCETYKDEWCTQDIC